MPNTGAILVTGGCGFIGSALVRYLLSETNLSVVNLDALTYAASPRTLRDYGDHSRYRFIHADIRDPAIVRNTLSRYRPTGLINIAAETHVDRSIDEPFAFVQTNVIGTCVLLQAALDYWMTLPEPDKARFRFHHVSTDEVYGSLSGTGKANEVAPYAPSSPYAASKAASDHFVRAWHRTHGLPVLISRSSNNYGPYQFPEKLIPLTIIRGIQGKTLPVYGRGENVRTWLFVEDHVCALWLIFTRGKIGESYNVGDATERRNIDVVRQICRHLDMVVPDRRVSSHESLIRFVTDRPGHDLRYTLDITKVRRELGWQPKIDFDDGLRMTVDWYLANTEWWDEILSGRYDGERLGLANAVT